MQFSDNTLLIVGGVFVAVILLIAITMSGRKQTRTTTRPASRGPSSMQFVCAGCSQQFTHTKRTVAAWEKGTRRLFCNACHQKWRGSRPPQEPQASGSAGSRGQVPQPSASPARTSTKSSVRTHYSSAESRSGCLGFAVLFVVLPVVFFVAAFA